MKRLPDSDDVTDNFWDEIQSAACECWEGVCLLGSCDGCIFNAPKDEFKEWLRKALAHGPEPIPLSPDCMEEQIVNLENALKQIANVAHHGGLLGFDNISDAINEIRTLSLPWWDREECDHLQERRVYK